MLSLYYDNARVESIQMVRKFRQAYDDGLGDFRCWTKIKSLQECIILFQNILSVSF